MTIRFFWSDNEISAIKGSLGTTWRGASWIPPEGSKEIAEDVLSNERTLELSEAEVADLFAEPGRAMPSFSA